MIYDAKDFGATGNGLSDDTLALQAAIDAAAAAGGGQVHLPAGEYRVSAGTAPAGACLVLRSNVYLVGDGMGTSVIKVVDGSTQDIAGLIGAPIGEPLHDAGIADLSLDGNRSNSSGQIDGWCNGDSTAGASSNIRLERVEARALSGSGFVAQGQTSNLLLQDCLAQGNGLDGFVAGGLSASRMIGNSAHDNDGNGFHITGAPQDLGLSDNQAYANGGSGVRVQGDGSDSQPALLIQGGQYHDNAQAGILLQQTSAVSLYQAQVYGNGSAGIHLQGSTDSRIVANHIHDNAQQGAWPEILVQAYADGAGGGRVASANLIEGNQLTGSATSTYGVEEGNDGSHGTGVYANQISSMLNAEVLLYANDSLVSSEPSSQLLVQLEGSGGNDVLVGSAADELLLGLAGDDSLSGGAGNDTLVGGAGRDKLSGGDGADTFRFAELSDSYRTSSTRYNDTILDFDGTLDRIDLYGLGFSALGNGYNGTLQLSYSSASNRTYLQSLEPDANGNRFELAIQGNQLGVLNAGNVIFNANPTSNSAPLLNEALPDQYASENSAFSYSFAATSFTDPDADSLNYSASLGDGTALPAWLAFNAATRTFNGLPGLEAAGVYAIKVSASDGRGGLISDIFQLSVSDAPAGGATLSGSSGNDSLNGTAADEQLLGLGGDDTLNGGAGNDLLDGGAGRDTLSGGDGADTFRFAARTDSYRTSTTLYSDTIRDFDGSQDRIDLSGLGFSGLGNGYNGSLLLSYSSASDRTYLKSYQADASGNFFELGVRGNQLAALNASNLFFDAPPPPPPPVLLDLTGTGGNDSLTGSDANEVLLGNAGADKLDGGGGNDLLDGGAGKDTLTGGSGSDIFRFGNLLDSYRNYGPADIGAADTITDFNVGVDKIDLSALGITGLGNGYDHSLYMTLNDTGSKTSLKSREADADGNTFEIALTGNHLNDLSAADFIFAAPTPQNTLFVPTLGQSNARILRMFSGDEESGITEMLRQLQRYTDYDKVESLFFDANGEPVDLAVGGSTVTGRSTASAAEQAKAWWYSDTDQPGEALLQAVSNLRSQLATLQAKGSVTLALVWGQGEDNAMAYASATDKQAEIDLYMSNTLKVFDYLKAQLGTPDATFYLMLTGHYQQEAAALRGLSASEIAAIVAGTEAIRQAQQEMAASRDDVKIAVDYGDLPLRYAVDPLTYYDDVWHLHGDASEIIGQRLADFIAGDLGYQGDAGDNDDPNAISRYPANHILGGAGDDLLLGSAGGDTLDGGAGNDHMAGGAGSDVYIVDSAGDSLSETDPGTSSEEYDTVESAVDWTLGDNLEHLSLVGTQARHGTGNGLNNIIGGNAADNLLDGGAGADVLLGGAGADTYIVDNGGDRVVEGADAGIDRVLSSLADYLLPNNIETLVLTAPGNANGTGNALDNLLLAGAGDNVLNGGLGNDTLSYAQAGAGVVVRLSTSQAQATGGSGVDTLRNLENLIGSDYADTLGGHSSDNSLQGRAGNDVLNGGDGNDVLDGGSGADALNGGSGADRYVFGTLEDLGLGELADLIYGFNAGEGDRIDLSALDGNPLTAAREAFSYLDGAAFSDSDASGQLRFADGVLYGSSNADNAAEFMIKLLGVTDLSANDLLV